MGTGGGQSNRLELPRENPRGYSTEGVGRPPLAIWYPARGLGATRGSEALCNPRWECPCQTISCEPLGRWIVWADVRWRTQARHLGWGTTVHYLQPLQRERASS